MTIYLSFVNKEDIVKKSSRYEEGLKRIFIIVIKLIELKMTKTLMHIQTNSPLHIFKHI